MRQISFEETEAVGGGAGCGDLTMSIGLTGVSFGGTLSNWGSCGVTLWNSASDSLSGYGAHLTAGIPYGMAHVA